MAKWAWREDADAPWQDEDDAIEADTPVEAMAEALRRLDGDWIDDDHEYDGDRVCWLNPTVQEIDGDRSLSMVVGRPMKDGGMAMQMGLDPHEAGVQSGEAIAAFVLFLMNERSTGPLSWLPAALIPMVGATMGVFAASYGLEVLEQDGLPAALILMVGAAISVLINSYLAKRQSRNEENRETVQEVRAAAVPPGVAGARALSQDRGDR